MILEDVVEEHAEEAAFLWQQRELAVRAPDFDLSDIVEWDDRLEAHLDGLRLAGESGWHIARELGWDLPGEYFAAMSLALMHARADWIKEVMDAAEGDREATRGLSGALGWAEAKGLRGLVKKLLETRNPFGRQLGIAACAVHRVNPGPALGEALVSAHPGEQARALRAVGELGLLDELPRAEKQLEHADDEVRFWAAWSASLLGSSAAPRILALFAETDCHRRRQALELLMRVMPHEEAQLWLRQRLRGAGQRRWALMGAGMQGDPLYLEPLIRQFSDESLGRVAGEAFEMISGLDIYASSYEVLIPLDFSTVADGVARDRAADAEDPDEEPDDDSDDDSGEDEGLVLPDPSKVQPWLAGHKDRFEAGSRYLCGAPLSPEQNALVLREGRQRQRRAAALEMALATPGSVLFETRAPGKRQTRLLAGS